MKDEIIPGQEWVFDEKVASVFDDMLQRSIPGYNNMRDMTIRMLELVIPRSGCILDLGCSHGEMIDALDKKLNSPVLEFVGVDSSTAMVTRARTRFSGNEMVKIIHADIVDCEIQRMKYDAILSILTLQFVPLEFRQKIFKRIANGISPDGCFILVEKILGENSFAQEQLIDTYHLYKASMGYSEEQIIAKRKSLENVLVPLRLSENIAMLKEAGFTTVQPYWQNLNFVGIYASKEG